MSGQTNISEPALQEYLLQDAKRLRGYISAKIPCDLASVLAADDVMQEVWLTAFRGRATFRADRPDALARWITTLTNRRLVDAFRAARALKRRGQAPFGRAADNCASSMIDLFDQLSSKPHTPSSEASRNEAVQAVRLAMAGLPEERRMAVWMRHIDGCSVADIAKKLEKTIPAVHGLLFRARRQLSDQLGRASRFFSDGSSDGTARGCGVENK